MLRIRGVGYYQPERVSNTASAELVVYNSKAKAGRMRYCVAKAKITAIKMTRRDVRTPEDCPVVGVGMTTVRRVLSALADTRRVPEGLNRIVVGGKSWAFKMVNRGVNVEQSTIPIE
jgi:hypothetical protein